MFIRAAPGRPARRPSASNEALRPGPDPVWLVLSEKEADSDAHRDDHALDTPEGAPHEGPVICRTSAQTRVLGAGLRRGPFGPEIQAGPTPAPLSAQALLCALGVSEDSPCSALW